MGTFARHIAKKFKPTAHCCHICRCNFKLADDLNNHFKVHRSKIILRMSHFTERYWSNAKKKSDGKKWRQMDLLCSSSIFSAYRKALSIHCKLATPNDESSDLMVAITNTSQQTDLKIGHIYFSTGSFVNYWKNDILPFVLPMSKCDKFSYFNLNVARYTCSEYGVDYYKVKMKSLHIFQIDN